MPAPAAIAGTFADLKFIRSRSVCQIVIETPIENGAAVVAAFGTPQPGGEVEVAVARIQRGAAKGIAQNDTLEPSREKRSWGELSRAQQAGIRCNEDAFSRFLTEHYLIDGFRDAAEAVRAYCGCESRKYLDSVTSCARKWDALDEQYRAWLDAPKYGAA